MKLKRDKYDAAFSNLIRARDGWKCRRCGSTKDVQCCHIYTRGNKSIRLDEDNAVCLCKACHCYFTWRKQEWTDWCNKNLGEAHMEKLLIKYYARARKLSIPEKELLRQQFIERTKQYSIMEVLP